MEGYSYASDGGIAPGDRIVRWGKQWVTHAGHSALGTPHAPFQSQKRSNALKGRGMGTGMVELDGSRGEGGGQILRSALTLAMITGRPFSMKRIRANRDKPGLRPQHLAAVEAAAQLCSAELSGATVGSRAITFRPHEIKPRDFAYNIGTAGSTALVLQTIHLPLAMKAENPVRVVLEGGTFNMSAPSFPFLDQTWSRYMHMLGLKLGLAMPLAGFYPQGGGKLEAWIEPGKPKAIIADKRGELKGITGEAWVCRLNASIAERMLSRAIKQLAERGITLRTSDVKLLHGKGHGTGLTLTVEHAESEATFVSLGELGKPAEAVADEVVAELQAHIDVAEAAIDPHSADQLLLPLALAEGKSIFTTSEISEHLRTNCATIQSFCDRSIVLEEATETSPARVLIG